MNHFQCFFTSGFDCVLSKVTKNEKVAFSLFLFFLTFVSDLKVFFFFLYILTVYFVTFTNVLIPALTAVLQFVDRNK